MYNVQFIHSTPSSSLSRIIIVVVPRGAAVRDRVLRDVERDEPRRADRERAEQPARDR